jgi:hypothetical protein
MVKVSVEVRLGFHVPDFVWVDGKNPCDTPHAQSINLGDISDGDLTAMLNEFSAAVKAKAKKQRNEAMVSRDTPQSHA